MIAPGTRLGPYEIVSPLGAGGMGEVYRARDARLARDVAVKVLPEEFFEDEERRLRFEREAKALAALNHPGIAAVYSFEEISGRHLLGMELVEGEGLDSKVASGPLPLEESLSYAKQIAFGHALADPDRPRDGGGSDSRHRGVHEPRASTGEDRRQAEWADDVTCRSGWFPYGRCWPRRPSARRPRR